MASAISAISKPFKTMLFSALLAAAMAAVLVSAFQFEVGEKMGWKIPTGKEPETYNEWAAKNRFRIGDSVHFTYQKDSVLVVSSADYLNCNTSNPISKFNDGNTVFKFERSGFFYFIGGETDHCKEGQRIIIDVMHPTEEVEAPETAPSPAPGSGDGRDGGWDLGGWSPPGVNSTTKLSAVTHLMTALAGLFFMLYVFM